MQKSPVCIVPTHMLWARIGFRSALLLQLQVKPGKGKQDLPWRAKLHRPILRLAQIFRGLAHDAKASRMLHYSVVEGQTQRRLLRRYYSCCDHNTDCRSLLVVKGSVTLDTGFTGLLDREQGNIRPRIFFNYEGSI